MISVCHAEMNAILNKNQAECSGSTIYTTLYPCNECAKLIIQSGIENVIYAQVNNISIARGDSMISAFRMGPGSPLPITHF